MTKTKEKKKIQQSNWTTNDVIVIASAICLIEIIATVTTHVIMSRYDTPVNGIPTCIPDGTCICNSLNDVIVDSRVSEINYTYTCWVESDDQLKHKFKNAGENDTAT